MNAAPRRYVWLAVVMLAWGLGLFDGWRIFA